jgi:hypothetical protein
MLVSTQEDSNCFYSFREGADIITHNGQQLLTDGDEGVDIDLDAGVEVTYDPDDREDLVWI